MRYAGKNSDDCWHIVQHNSKNYLVATQRTIREYPHSSGTSWVPQVTDQYDWPDGYVIIDELRDDQWQHKAIADPDLRKQIILCAWPMVLE